MENISPHISYKEAIVSATGTRLGIDNTPPPEILTTMKITAEMLFEPLREHFGQPIRILSFYRCAALNKAVGGAKKSDHMQGRAIDVEGTNGITNAAIVRYFKEVMPRFRQCIWEFGTDKEPDWVHISYSDGYSPREFLRARKVKGKTIYEPF